MTSHGEHDLSADQASGPRHAPARPTDAVTPSRARRRRALLATGTAGAVLLAVGGVAAYAYRGEVPRGTTVLGIDIGGKSREEAARLLQAGLAGQARRLTAPVPVRLGEGGPTTQVEPTDVGLAVDVDATARAAAEGRTDPFSLLFGSRTVEPVIAVDAGAVDQVLRRSLGTQARAMRMPAIAFDGTTPRATYPKPGKDLDAQKAAQALRDGWLGTHPVVVPLVEVHPATTAAEVDRLVAELAAPAVSGAVTVTTDRGTVTVSPAAIAKSLVLTADDAGKIIPRVDEKKLRAALGRSLAAIETPAKNAGVTLVAGKPRVTPGADGRQLDTAALARDLLTVLPKRDGRTIAGVIRTASPATTVEAVAALGIKERVSTFTTRFTGGLSSPRSQNIVQIAKEVDGAVVKPGETFSLNGHTGVRGYAQGYQDAPVIQGGKLTPGVGGGASQFTTTLFNAAYYAGLEDVEHKPHSYYFTRYPAVIESTIFYPDLDLKFKNDSRYGVLIDTSYTSSTITVSMWSTKVYDSVTTEWSARRNFTSPRTIRLEAGPECIATDGIDGFTQDAWRIFRAGGKAVKREKFTWTYQAEPRFICGT